MKTVTIIETESTAIGDMAELILDKSIEPAIGMILMDANSLTWEITGTLHDSKRTTGDTSTIRWTLQCTPLNTGESIHKGEYKLMH